MRERLIAQMRHERILAAINRDGVVSVQALVEALDAAPMTIRRDLNSLAERGLIRRVHGGAASANHRRATPGLKGLTLAMVVPSDHYWDLISYSSQGEAVAAGARFLLRSVPGHGPKALEVAATMIRQSRADGLIFAPPITEPEHEIAMAWLAGLRTPTVLVERKSEVTLETTQSVRADHARGAAMAVQHLHDHGHRRIGLIHQSFNAAGLSEIRSGWLSGLARWRLAEFAYELPERRDSEGDRQLVAQLQQDQISAVMVVGQPHAVTVSQICHEQQLSIPRELSVVSYGDSERGFGHPELTAIKPPRELVGRLAVRLLGDHLRNGREHRMQQVLISPALVERDSVRRVIAIDHNCSKMVT